MFIRFVIHQADGSSGRRQGLFQAMAALKRQGVLPAVQEARYEEVRAWFNEHLKVPDRFARASRAHPQRVALSWFRDTAREHIDKMREIARILDEHDILVDTIQTDRPGYIVYEDEFQVAAEPFRDTAT